MEIKIFVMIQCINVVGSKYNHALLSQKQAICETELGDFTNAENHRRNTRCRINREIPWIAGGAETSERTRLSSKISPGGVPAKTQSTRKETAREGLTEASPNLCRVASLHCLGSSQGKFVSSVGC